MNEAIFKSDNPLSHKLFRLSGMAILTANDPLVRVTGKDDHRLDKDGDGWGCELNEVKLGGDSIAR